MARVCGEIVIDCPVETVFDFVADECNEPRYNPQMLSVEKLTPGPVGVGTRYDAQMRSGSRTLPLTLEFTCFERPNRLRSHSEFSGMNIDGELAFESLGGSTRMRWVWNLAPQGGMKLLGPLISWMGRKQELRIWSELKRYLENRPVEAST